ncbi:MAG: hypothetical protein K2G77_05360, partial [Muribaculaceae bacterium]|nr:hypothetical protein [Muribaculaceae bacterium]
MKKKVLGLALMAMALVGFNGMAQNNSQKNAQCCKAQTECTKSVRGMKKEAREMKNPYEGLTLTDAQKSKLAELDSKRIADHKAKMEARKSDNNGQKVDKSKSHADMKARMEARKADKLEYLKEVKAIIGPDQYVVFLENFYVNGSGNNNGCKAIRQGKDGHKGMAHNKGMNGQRKGGDRKGNRNVSYNNAQS